MRTIAAISLVVLLCAISFAAGYSLAMRMGAFMVLDNTKMIAIWRESDWAVSSIRYAKMIRSIENTQYREAVDQACSGIANDLKNLREIAPVGEKPRIPTFSENTYVSSCK